MRKPVDHRQNRVGSLAHDARWMAFVGQNAGERQQMIEHVRSEQYFPMRQREGAYSLFCHLEGQAGLIIGLLLGIALVQRNQGRFLFLALVLHRILARGVSQR